MKSAQQKYDEAVSRALLGLVNPQSFNSKVKQLSEGRHFKTLEEAKLVVAHNLGIRIKETIHSSPESSEKNWTTKEPDIFNPQFDSLANAVFAQGQRNKPKEVKVEASATTTADGESQAKVEVKAGAKKAGKKGTKASKEAKAAA